MTISTSTKCDNCGRIAETGMDIPVQDETGTAFEIAICDSEDCQTNCIPTHPSDFFALQSGNRVRWTIGTCDECNQEFDTDNLVSGKTEQGYTPWYCAYCAARLQHNDTAAKVLLNILKSKENQPMELTTITREDGTTEQVLMRRSVTMELTDNLTHEFMLWNDGSVSVEALVPQFKGDTTLDLIHLDLAAARQLKSFLNSEKVSALLDTSTC